MTSPPSWAAFGLVASPTSATPSLVDAPGGPITGERVVPCCWRNSSQGGPMSLAGDMQSWLASVQREQARLVRSRYWVRRCCGRLWERTGRLYVFKRGRNGWRDVATLRGSGTVTADMFGVSLAAAGSTLVVGVNGHSDLPTHGQENSPLAAMRIPQWRPSGSLSVVSSAAPPPCPTWLV